MFTCTVPPLISCLGFLARFLANVGSLVHQVGLRYRSFYVVSDPGVRATQAGGQALASLNNKNGQVYFPIALRGYRIGLGGGRRSRRPRDRLVARVQSKQAYSTAGIVGEHGRVRRAALV